MTLQVVRAFPAFSQLLSRLHLQLSPGKSQALTFIKPRELKSKPMMQVNGVNVYHVPTLKLLDITIDEHQSCIPHIKAFKIKLLNY